MHTMKKLITLVFTVLTSSVLFAQQNNSSELVQVAKEGLIDVKEVTYHASPAALQVDQYIIPISSNTQVKLQKSKKNYSILFSLQKGTAITSTSDSQWRRASFELTFKSKQAAKDFIRLFETAAKN
jgi:hypothetical protein